MRQFLGAIEPMKIVTICVELRQVPFKMVEINVIEIGNFLLFDDKASLKQNSSKKGSILNG